MRARTREEVLALLKKEKPKKEEIQNEEILELEEDITTYEDDENAENKRIFYKDTKSKTCYVCGGTLFWISKYNGHLYCAICHPPADQSIVAGWREYKKGDKF